MVIRLFDNMLLTERRMGSPSPATPQIAALLVSVVVPAALGVILGRLFLGPNGAIAFGLVGLLAGIALFAWRVAVLAPKARFAEDRLYDKETRLKLSKEYRDSHSASYRGEK